MNFQDLAKVETAATYLDTALRRGREENAATRVGGRKPSKLEIVREKELRRIRVIQRNLVRPLQLLLDRFPSIDRLPPFYLALVKATLDYPELKKGLGALRWAINRIGAFSSEYVGRLQKARELSLVQRLPREYIGRVSSVMRQIAEPLRFLDQARKTMKRFPAIKTGMPSVAIYGFPNVGKTTLLSRLTGSTPDIQDYAFTTKELNVGNLSVDGQKVQVVDTPGTLDRPDRMNHFELQAELVLRHVADLVVFVFDLTEPYALADQKKLRSRLRERHPGLPVITFCSKKDIVGEDAIAHALKGAVTGTEELAKAILKRLPASAR